MRTKRLSSNLRSEAGNWPGGSALASRGHPRYRHLSDHGVFLTLRWISNWRLWLVERGKRQLQNPGPGSWLVEPGEIKSWKLQFADMLMILQTSCKAKAETYSSNQLKPSNWSSSLSCCSTTAWVDLSVSSEHSSHELFKMSKHSSSRIFKNCGKFDVSSRWNSGNHLDN